MTRRPARRRRGRTCSSCERRTRPGTSGRARVPPRRGAVRGHPGPGGPLRRRACRPRRSSSRASAPRSRSARTAAATAGACGASARRGSLDSRVRARSERSRCARPAGRSGVALLDGAGGTRTATRRRSRCRAGGAQRVLVVLPDATWQARNRLEANGDGYPDLLPEDAAVSARRPFAGDGLPPGFAGDQSGVLRFLDRERLALRHHDRRRAGRAAARAARPLHGDPLRGRAAVLAAPRRSGCCARTCKAGGRLAWLGRGGFDWSVECRRAGACCAGGARPCRALFGERLRYERRGGAGRGPERPHRVLPRRAGLVRAVRAARGVRSACRRARDCSPRPGRASRGARWSSTGTDGGVVARVGVDGFGRALRTSPAAARIMRRLWALLSR